MTVALACLRAVAPPLLLLLAAGAAAAEGPDLSEGARAFLSEYERAGWTGESVANGVRLTVRMAALGSEGMLDALRAGRALPDVARIVLPEDGFFFNRSVPGGAYRIDFSFADGHPITTLVGEDGAAVASRPFWIHGSTDARAGGSVAADGEAATVEITAGKIAWRYRFVPARRHAELATGLRIVAAGPVRLLTDLPAGPAVDALAKLAADSIPIHADLLGVPPPDGPYAVHLIADEKRYLAFDRAITGGRFEDAYAFSSPITEAAYLWYGPSPHPDVLAEGVPLRMKALLLHEVHHLVAAKGYPGRAEFWPTWIEEGLAETATERALAKARPADGRAFEARMRGSLSHARDAGTLPPLPDLLGGHVTSGRSGYYAAAHRFVRAMVSQPEKFARIHEAFAAAMVEPDAALDLRRAAEAAYGPLDRWYESALTAALEADERPPFESSGYADVTDEGWRIESPQGRGGALIFAETAMRGEAVEVSATFAWHPADRQHQFDFYLGHRQGRHAEEFLKLAVLPQRIVLFWLRDGSWRTVGSVDYDEPLPVVADGGRAWHTITVRHDAATRIVRATFATGRWAEFELPGHLPVAGGRVGVGCYDGVVYVKDVQVR